MRKGRGIKVRREGRKQERNSSDREQGIESKRAGRKEKGHQDNSGQRGRKAERRLMCSLQLEQINRFPF